MIIYLNHDDPLVRWEIAVGRIRSHWEPPSIPDSCSFRFAQIMANCNETILGGELLLEHMRSTYFPEHPSRLAAIFAFETQEECERLIPNWRMPFNFDKMYNVTFPGTSQISRHDSGWITHHLGVEDTPKETKKWMEAYWDGIPYDKDQPDWEYLVNGTGMIGNVNNRKILAQEIFTEQPNVAPMLKTAARAFGAGVLDAAQAKYVLCQDADKNFFFRQDIFLNTLFDITKNRDDLETELREEGILGLPRFTVSDLADLERPNWLGTTLNVCPDRIRLVHDEGLIVVRQVPEP